MLVCDALPLGSSFRYTVLALKLSSSTVVSLLSTVPYGNENQLRPQQVSQ